MGITTNPEYESIITGSITSVSQNIDLATNNKGSITVQVQGTWVGTLLVESSNDSSNYIANTLTNLSNSSQSTTITANGIYLVNSAGLSSIRLRSSAWTSGTATITSDSSDSVTNTIANQGGTWNLNNITGTISLPTGAANATNQTTGNSSLSSIDTKLTTTNSNLSSIDAGIPASLGQTTMAASMPVTFASNQTPLEITGSISATTSADHYSSYSPDPSNVLVGSGNISTDASGRLETHSTVTTDEGSFRDHFINTNIATALTGTLTFTNNSTTITGSGTLFTTELKSGDYIKKTADANSLYVQVDTVISDTQLELATVYSGTTAATSAVFSNYSVNTTSSGSISVGSSVLTLSTGSTSGAIASIFRAGDYLPYNVWFKASISQRVTNQTISIGMRDVLISPNFRAEFMFDGTTNTTVKCVSSSSSAAQDTTTTTITLPSSATTSSSNTYEIDLTNNQVTFLVNKIVVAIHTDNLPGPYEILAMAASATNTGAASNTNVNIDYILFYNTNQIEITNSFLGEPLKVQLMGKSSTTGLPVDLNLDGNGNLLITALSGFGSEFSFGDVTTAALTRTLVKRTTYTEQTTNAQRSIASASANDTAAGTGARTIKITYLDQTGAGPFTEILTLNGTTGVNTVATNICFIEQLEVLTAGSGGVNAGIITLYSAINKGGVTIGTVAASDNQTFWCHHYVPTGKICNVTGISSGHNGTTVGSGALFTLNTKLLNVTNSVETQISDFVRLYGQTSTFSRTYTSPIKVTGPARIQMYVTPETGSSTIYRSAFDFFEP